MEEIIALFGTLKIQIILILIGVDIILGIIAAIVRKEFVFRKLAMFMKGPVLGYIFGFVVIELIAQALPSLTFIIWIAFVLIVLALLGSIFRNLAGLGLPLPGSKGIKTK